MPNEILTAEQVTEEAKAHYYKNQDAESRYESAFCLGWLKSAYDLLAHQLREAQAKSNRKQH